MLFGFDSPCGRLRAADAALVAGALSIDPKSQSRAGSRRATTMIDVLTAVRRCGRHHRPPPPVFADAPVARSNRTLATKHLQGLAEGRRKVAVKIRVRRLRYF